MAENPAEDAATMENLTSLKNGVNLDEIVAVLKTR